MMTMTVKTRKRLLKEKKLARAKRCKENFTTRKYLHCFAIRTALLMLKMSNTRKNRQMENLSRVRR